MSTGFYPSLHPESFDYEHYWETGETWDHEVDDPITAYQTLKQRTLTLPTIMSMKLLRPSSALVLL